MEFACTHLLRCIHRNQFYWGILNEQVAHQIEHADNVVIIVSKGSKAEREASPPVLLKVCADLLQGAA